MTKIINIDDYRPRKKITEDTPIILCPECDSEIFYVGKYLDVYCAECWAHVVETNAVEDENEELEITFEIDEDLLDGSDS